MNPPGGTVSVTLRYRAAPDCSDAGSAPSGHVKLIRWNPAVPLNTPGRVTTLFDQSVTLVEEPVTPPPGTMSYGGGPTFRGVGSTTVDVSSNLIDATNAFGFTFSCQRPGKSRHTVGDLITIIGPMAAPGTTYSIGGTVSGLTGAVVLQNSGGDSQTVTAPNSSFIFTPIAAGAGYSVSVLTQPSGQTCSVVQNGSGTNVQANVTNMAVSCSAVSGPVPLVATAIAAGFWNSLAVATDGTVWAWGYLVDPTTGGYKSAAPWATTPVRVQGLTGVRTVALSSESGAFYALHIDGTVSAWGRNDVGQLGDRTTTTRFTPVKVLQDATTPMDEVCSIAAGSNMLLMARETGCSPGNRSISFGPWIVGLFSGQNFGGDNATGFPFNGAIAKLPSGWPAGQTASIMTAPDAANAGGAVAIRTGRGDGYVWGNNGGNRLGAGVSVPFAGSATGPVLGGWSGLYPLEMGRDFAIAADETGTLESVGRNVEGQLGDGTTTSRTTMAPVLGLPVVPVTAYSVGQVSAAAIMNGELWAWGWNDFSGIAVTRPGRVGTGTGFTQVSVGDMHSLAIGPGGEVYSWGVGTNGGLGRSGSGSLPAVVMRPLCFVVKAVVVIRR